MRFTSQREPAPAPQPNQVIAEPATVQAAKADYDSRNGGATEHPSSLQATPHTLGRHR